MIQVRDLTKRFGRLVAVDGISFDVQRGETLGLLGPNGAGKSTTMRMMVGLLTPTSGAISVDGHDASGESLAVRRLIGHLPEGTPLYGDMTVLAFLRFVAEAKGLPRAGRGPAIERAMTECGVLDMGARMIRHLSKGYRQRVGLAQAILGDPPVLILDEPTVGLDPQQIIEIRNLIRSWSGKRTVIISTHILPEVDRTCDRVIIISRGRLRAEGTPGRLAADHGEGGEIRLTVRAVETDLRSALGDLPELTSLSVAAAADGDALCVAIAGRHPDSLRRAALAAVAEHGWDLVELSAGGAGLEEAFLRAIAEETVQ